MICRVAVVLVSVLYLMLSGHSSGAVGTRTKADAGGLDQKASGIQSEQLEALQWKSSDSWGRLPLSFEPNRGQVADPRVQYIVRSKGYNLYFTPDENVFVLRGKVSERQPQRDQFRVSMVGAAKDPRIVPEKSLAGRSHYILGNRPDRWRTDIPNFGRIRFERVYPGIDLVYYGNQGQLEYDFVVAPDSDPGRVRMKFSGARSLSLDSAGDLRIETRVGALQQHKPVAYQEIDGTRKPVECEFDLQGDALTFRVGDYDRSHTLTIDPTLTFSTYLGGTGQDQGFSIAADSDGNIYACGRTSSTDFPLVNPFMTDGAGEDIWVSKINSDGSAQLFSTYIGGNANDGAHVLVIDPAGSIFVSGDTNSSDFPVTNGAFQTSFKGATDTFLLKLNSTGSALTYCSYIGGTGIEKPYGLDIDIQSVNAGDAFVMGYTSSSDFPTQVPTQSALNGTTDAFVFRMNPDGTALLFSTYLGGSGDEGGIAFLEGNAPPIQMQGLYYNQSTLKTWVTGRTNSSDFPLTSKALQPFHSGKTDAFVTVLLPVSSLLVYSSYLGGSEDDFGTGIGVGPIGGPVFVTGATSSPNFPLSAAFQFILSGPSDAFVVAMIGDPSSLVGVTLKYSTLLGGDGNDAGTSVFAYSERAYVAGETDSPNFPVVNPVQSASGGGKDAFVSIFDPKGLNLLFSTFLGGQLDDTPLRMAVDDRANAYVTGFTFSTNFPTSIPIQADYKGNADAFISKIGGLAPSFEITMSKSTYTVGDTVTATEFRIKNLSAAASQPVRLRIWLEPPGTSGLGIVDLINVGGDGSFTVPANADVNIGPVSLFPITSGFPPATFKGTWKWNSEITCSTCACCDTLLSRDLNTFVVQ